MGNYRMMKKLKYILKTSVSILKTEKKVPVTCIKRDNKILDNKIALITGGSGGIGYAIAKAFIDAGCQVIITGTKEKKLIKCCDRLGRGAKYILLDMTETSAFEGKVQYLFGQYGKIDILVNSAGIHLDRPFVDFLNVTEEEYDSIMDVNLKGIYFLCQKMASQMINHKIRGHILNISSQAALEPAWSPYRLSKWGVRAITEGLAQQLLPYGIIVNGIAPGPSATGMQGYKEGDSIYTEGNDVGRYIMPQEIAEYATLLVSNLGDMVVGDSLYISGGRGIIDVR